MGGAVGRVQEHANLAEGQPVPQVSYDNFAILDFELSRVGAEARGPAAEELFGIGRPDLDFVAIAAGMGVPGVRVEDARAFTAALREALGEPGPRLIEARI